MKGNDSYYRRLQANFDWYASKYDEKIEENDIENYMRETSSGILLGLFAPGDTVLEVGCGTGQETIRLLSRGIRVQAVDISSMMIETLKRKAEAEGVSANLSTFVGKAADIGKMIGKGELFDGVFSTFGAINSEPNVAEFISGVGTVLKPGGYFVAGVWNRFCLFEILFYGLTLRWRRLLSRFNGISLKGSSRFFIDTMSYSVRDFKHMLGGSFTIESICGVPVIAPPPDFFHKLKALHIPVDILLRADAWFSDIIPFSNFGDFSIIVSRKKYI